MPAELRRFERAAGWLPALVVLVGVLTTLVSTQTLAHGVDAARRERLATAAHHIAGRVDRHLSDVAVTVRAVAGITTMQGRDLPTDTELAGSLRAVSTGQPTADWLPSLVGLVALRPDEAATPGAPVRVAAITAVRRDVGLRAAAPIDDPAALAALDGAAATGSVAVSADLAADTLQGLGADVVVAAPLYGSREVEAATATTRERAATGWIVALVDADAVAQEAATSVSLPAIVRIHDDAVLGATGHGDASSLSGPAHVVHLPVAGRDWTVEMIATGPLLTGIERAQPYFTLGSGLLITAAAAVIAWLLLNHRRRAIQLVDAATLELSATNERLERSNRELREFAAVVSHDLKSPLTAVRGYLDVLPRFLHQELDDRATEILGRARSGADHMRALIDDLLDYAAMENVRMERQTVDLTVVVAEALGALDLDVEQRHAEVEVDVLEPVPGDPRMLRQLATNLLGNALKFVPPGRTPRVRVTSRRLDGRVEVCFDDNGVGIPADERQTVLEAFQRSSRTREFSGTGLGLAIVGRIVAAHGGAVAVEDSDLGGARIRVTLPAT